MFLTVDRYRQDLSLIAATLGIDREKLSDVLATLESLQLIHFSDKGYRVTQENTHLSADSPLYRPYRTLQRLKTLERMDKVPGEKAYSFTVQFSSNPKVRANILNRILKLIGEIEQEVA